jgi:hypothetical protein
MHGFTLLLPEDYRCHGPEILGFSFFATAPDHNDGGVGAESQPMIDATLGATEPADRRYRPFWRAPAQNHPRLSRFKDILGYHYAVILLTRAEFDGPFCSPPEISRESLAPDLAEKPRWLEIGSLSDFANYSGVTSPTEPHWLTDLLGAIPPAGLDINRALRCTPRKNDPNAGKTPCEPWAREESDYAPPYGEDANGDYVEHAWARGHATNHIGGTMRPVQAVPRCSPFYVEFDESFGGYNFGCGGKAQLDFKDMAFDWACG